jgi:hypothetical protein
MYGYVLQKFLNLLLCMCIFFNISNLNLANNIVLTWGWLDIEKRTRFTSITYKYDSLLTKLQLHNIFRLAEDTVFDSFLNQGRQITIDWAYCAIYKPPAIV